MTQPSILVVDDELLIRDLLYDFFQQQGWTIAVAENGERALEILRTRKIDLLLTDIKMPQMDGLALTNQVRSLYPDIPVVLMTGYPSVETAVEGIKAKVEDYIIKPFNINKLFKVLKSQLEEVE
jgi:DNA-binding NtrC family response regulator